MKQKNLKLALFYGTKNGQVYYIVEFPQDESIEPFEEGFVAQVYIWEDNSKPWLLYLGNGMIENIEQETEWLSLYVEFAV